MKRIEAVLFDVDDTLFDRRRAQDLVLDILMRELPALFDGVEIGRVREAFRESDRISSAENDAGTLRESFRARRSKLFLDLIGAEQRFWEEAAALYVKHYPTVRAPVSGAEAVVEALGRAFKLGVVSNGFPDVQYRKLETIGVREHFRCVVLSEEVGLYKPDAAIFLHAARLLGVAPEACMHVGDIFEMDVAGAKRAGMRACWLNARGARRPAGDVIPDAEIVSLGELASVIRAIQD